MAIVLFNTMNNYKLFQNAGDFTFSKSMIICKDFIIEILVSMLIGLLVGFIASYLTKRMRFLAQSVVSETVFIFCFAL